MKKLIVLFIAIAGFLATDLNAQSSCIPQEDCNPKQCCPAQVDCCTTSKSFKLGKAKANAFRQKKNARRAKRELALAEKKMTRLAKSE